MTAPGTFLEKLHEVGIGFFTGVPDSLMKELLAAIGEEHLHHITAVNEGAAVALASGYYLATGKLALVYLQNSGLGNAVNPLTSLANKDMYGIPMLLLIGWRGQPGTKDEPQHKKMGAVTLALLAAVGLPHFILKATDANWVDTIETAALLAQRDGQPVALVLEKDFFEEGNKEQHHNGYDLSPEAAIRSLYTKLDADTAVVCTTGYTGRIFYQVNADHDNRLQKYFLNAGAMGHAASLASALAQFGSGKVLLLDGDGALLMHMGALATVAQHADNLLYVLLNNGAHGSVGGQPTAAFDIDCCAIARACGFAHAVCLSSASDLAAWLSLPAVYGTFVEIRINTDIPSTLPRPKESFAQAKEGLMKALGVLPS